MEALSSPAELILPTPSRCLVVLDRNPLEIDPLQIKNVRVGRTIKEDSPNYEAAGPAA